MRSTVSIALSLVPTLALAGPHAVLSKRQDAPLTPGGKKAGSAGGRALPYWQDHLGWWYDWGPSPEVHGDVVSVAMLWGAGNNGDMDAQRFQDFQNLSEAPKYLLGFNEPDCDSPDTSAGIEVPDAVQLWNDNIAPWGEKGSLLGSPSMCTQSDESWLQDFNNQDLDRSWDFTAVHIYKPDMDGVQKVIDHYWDTYQKPIWVTEFGCVYDQQDFTPCEDQGMVDQWISDVVDLFEGNEHVMAYSYTDGGGLGSVWPPTNEDGSELTESGQKYLDAISKYA